MAWGDFKGGCGCLEGGKCGSEGGGGGFEGGSGGFEGGVRLWLGGAVGDGGIEGGDADEGGGGEIDNHGVDYVSELPDDILAKILKHLPLQDVSKLRILSRRWRYLNPYGPDLHFDHGIMFGLPRRYVEPSERDYKKLLRRFIGGGNHITKLWTDINISSFRIDFSLGKKSSFDIDRWIKFAVGMGVRQLHLCCGIFAYDKSLVNQIYTFSTHLLSEAFRLRHLTLSGCRLKPNFDGQFHSLRALELGHVHLGQYELRYLLLRCLNLEELILYRCFCPEKLTIDGPFLQLKCLKLSLLRGLKVVEVSATKLTNFYYCGPEIKFSFSRVPNLEDMQLHIFFYGETYMFDDISTHVPHFQCLSVYGPLRLKYRVPACPTKFQNVIKLDFKLRHSSDLRGVIDFLRACPFLQKLKIVVGILSDMLKDNGRSTLQIQRSIHSHLKEVEFTGFFGTENHIDLIIYLLETAIVLQRIAISLEDKAGHRRAWEKCVPFDDGKRESFIKQLQGKRASKSAVVIFESVPIVI